MLFNTLPGFTYLPVSIDLDPGDSYVLGFEETPDTEFNTLFL